MCEPGWNVSEEIGVWGDAAANQDDEPFCLAKVHGPLQLFR